MNRSLLIVIVLCVIGLLSGEAFAKRAPPAEAAPVRHGDVEFRVRHHTGGGYLPGFVEAWDTSKNQQIWLRQIYVIRRNPDLEQDVQDVFVTGLKLIADRNALEISNERGGLFELNLETLEVKTLKGRALISVK